jgi:hypothetical protein
MSSPTKKQLQTLWNYAKEMYKGIKEEDNKPLEQKWLNEYIKYPFGINISEYHKTDVSKLKIASGFPRAFFNKEGKLIAIQLRPLQGEKQLVIGCGNNPTTPAYNSLCSKEEHDKLCKEYFRNDRKFAELIIQQRDDERKSGIHNHEGAITINPDVNMNPTIVAFFGWYEMPEELLPSNHFDDIESEGIDLRGMPFFKSDYERIVK